MTLSRFNKILNAIWKNRWFYQRMESCWSFGEPDYGNLSKNLSRTFSQEEVLSIQNSWATLICQETTKSIYKKCLILELKRFGIKISKRLK